MNWLYFLIYIALEKISLEILVPILSNINLDVPNSRSSHKLPTPTGGGITFVFLFNVYSILNGFWLPLYCLPLAIIGFLDDFLKDGLSRIIRFNFQIFTTFIIIWNSNLFNYYLIDIDNLLIRFLLFLFLLLFGVAAINFANFMDGLDGLLTLMMIIIFSTLSLGSNTNYLILVFLLIPFLIKNWNPAKVFMGDGGSTFLGAFLFGTIMSENSFYEASKLAVLTFPVLGDAFITVLKKIFYKQNIFLPHRLHLFQRLKISGFSEMTITLLFSLVVLINCIIYNNFNINILILSSIISLFFGLFIDKKYAVSFKSLLKKDQISKMKKK